MESKSSPKNKLKALLDAVQKVRQEDSQGDHSADNQVRFGFEPQSGDILGDFKLIREVGRGGMGVVFEAEQLSLKRRVAVKMLFPSLASSMRTLRRFHREAEAVARVSHPAIIPVYEVGTTSGIHYFAMRFLPGPDLAELLEDLGAAQSSGKSTVLVDLPQEEEFGLREEGDKAPNPIPTSMRLPVRNYVFQAIELIARIAEGLEVAHKNGVIHRDVKPGNLVIDRNGRLVLTDFGIARSELNQTITRTGEFIGSPGYISPEQAMAKRIDVDHRTDIYSLGVTLYEFLTLEQPFLRETLEGTLRAILTKEPVSPRKLNPRLPKDVETVVMKAIAKDPDKRFSTAAEMAGELRRILNFEAIRSTPASPLTRARRVIRNHRPAAIAASSVALLFLSIGGFVSYLNSQKQALEDRSEMVRSTQAGGAAEEELATFIAEGFVVGDVLDLVDQAEVVGLSGTLEEMMDLMSRVDTRLSLGFPLGDPRRESLRPKISRVKWQLIDRLERELLRPGALTPARQSRYRGFLERMLLDQDPLVSKNAAVSLSRIQNPLAIAALVDAVFAAPANRELELRPDFIESLARIPGQGALGALEQFKDHFEPSVRKEVVRALETRPEAEAKSILLWIQEHDPEISIRVSSRQALGGGEQ